MAQSQWLFSLDALYSTPSLVSLEQELHDRAAAIELLFRLGASLALPTSAMCTAATWFHRFYMRYAMEDFDPRHVSASCIFLATKTEECGRKLRDVARVAYAKSHHVDVRDLPADSYDVDCWQSSILITEETLLEALCFEFVVESPHVEMLNMFESLQPGIELQEFAWSVTHDSYRTPLCLLYPSRIIAIACYVLAQRVYDGPNSPSLDVRISACSPSKSLPTPPSHKPPSPDASRAAVDYYNLQESETEQVAEALVILLEFYSSQNAPHLQFTAWMTPPARRIQRRPIFVSRDNLSRIEKSQPPLQDIPHRTPSYPDGRHTPATVPSEVKNS